MKHAKAQPAAKGNEGGKGGGRTKKYGFRKGTKEPTRDSTLKNNNKSEAAKCKSRPALRVIAQKKRPNLRDTHTN